MWGFYEIALLRERIGCASERVNDRGDAFTCTVVSGAEIVVNGWDDRAINSVVVKWLGDLSPAVQDKIADLYTPDAKQDLTAALAMSVGVTGSRYRTFEAGWLSVTHWFYKETSQSQVEHTVNLSP
ncbi:hypothetical protein [Sinorhizobium meliloti]|uniref:hypothetical protein n=1 Tax=Rhizobium meliloti TaxID=382 RepID=UPI000FD983F6|nr:hypothetical protein [Sinorhizobium meliloti]RVM04159.1 hypothetical protein CN134_32130 [Sinorhizobium meliloti]RVO21844.1 hypothetical protein CN098_32590 [Sinorhizobium meliloti]